MAGTASELCYNTENETSNLNDFDLFSLWLFEKIKANRLLHTDSCDSRPILNAASPSILPGDTECIIAGAGACDDYPATHYSLVIKSKLSSKEERLAKMREHQRRERKEALYSYHTKSRNTNS